MRFRRLLVKLTGHAGYRVMELAGIGVVDSYSVRFHRQTEDIEYLYGGYYLVFHCVDVNAFNRGIGERYLPGKSEFKRVSMSG